MRAEAVPFGWCQDGVELVPTFGWPESSDLFDCRGAKALAESVEGAEDDVDDAVVGSNNGVSLHQMCHWYCSLGEYAIHVRFSQQPKCRVALTVGVSSNPAGQLVAMPSMVWSLKRVLKSLLVPLGWVLVRRKKHPTECVFHIAYDAAWACAR